MGAWRRDCYEMLWPNVGDFPQLEEGQSRCLLLGGLAVAAFRFGADVHTFVMKSHLDSKGRVMGRASPFEESVGRQPKVTGLRQELQSGLRVQGRGNGGKPLLHDDTKREGLHRPEPSILNHGSKDRFQHLGHDPIARPGRGRILGGGKFKLPGEPRQTGRAAPGSSEAREFTGGCARVDLNGCRGYREVPGGVAEKLQPLPLRRRLGRERGLEQAQGWGEQRRVTEAVVQGPMEGEQPAIRRERRIIKRTHESEPSTSTSEGQRGSKCWALTSRLRC